MNIANQQQFLEFEKIQIQRPKRNYKILALQAFFAGILIGIANYLIGLISYLGIKIVYMQSIGNMVICSPYFLLKFMNYMNNKDSSEYINQFYYLNKQAIYGLLLSTITIFFSLLFRVFSFYICQIANKNQGISSSLFSFSLLFTGIFNLYYFNQRLKDNIIFGFIILILCSIVISLSDIDLNNQSGENMMMLLIVLISLFAAFFQSIQNFSSKYISLNLNYPALDYSFDSQFLFGILMLPLFVFSDYTFIELQIGLPGCSLLGFGFIILTDGIFRGLVPRLKAIQHISAIIHLLLCTFLNYIIPNSLQILGILLVILGVFAITYIRTD